MNTAACSRSSTPIFRGKLLGCGDGPASFNAEATRRGGDVVSIDPIYHWDAAPIRDRITATREQILEQTRSNADEFVWDSIRSVDELGRIRMAAMTDFLADYDAGKRDGRYIEAELPTLPFDDGSFDLALCSHFLFLYSKQLGESFHVQAIQELCRVSREVRIFPLLALGGKPSPYVDRCVDLVRGTGHAVSIDNVPYEFQQGGNQMLRICCVTT